MSLYEIFFFIIYHYIADFLFQTNEQANNKSRSIRALLSHTVWYSALWYIPASVYALTQDDYTQWSATLFVLITFQAHTITDYFTSRISARLYEKQMYRQYFLVIGFDQMLHYIQLYLTYYILFK